MPIRPSPRRLIPAAAVLVFGSIALAQSAEAPPVCISGGPYFAECLGASTQVAVDGSASFDPNGTPLTYLWFEECPFGFFEDPTSAKTNFVLDMTGVCSRQCVYALRVLSGGQQVACVSTARVDDTTAPTLAVPADVIGVWGTLDTSVAGTGSASALDLCDPAPVVTYSDTIIPQQGPGHEQTIVRHWQAIDSCQHVSMADQTIVQLSPATNAQNLEVDVTTCTDVLNRSSAGPFFYVTVLGRANTAVSALNPATLRLSKLGDATHSVAPTNPNKFPQQQLAVHAALELGDCNPQGNDGKKDLKLEFNYDLVRTTLGLDALPAGSTVYLMVTGKRWNGTAYLAAGVMTVQ